MIAISTGEGRDTSRTCTNAIIEHLKRQGIVRGMLKEDIHLAHARNRKTDRNHYCVAIPSMITWLENECALEHHDYRELIDEVVRRKLKRPVAAWRWEHDLDVPELKPLQPQPGHRYRRQSEATGLVVPVPSDED